MRSGLREAVLRIADSGPVTGCGRSDSGNRRRIEDGLIGANQIALSSCDVRGWIETRIQTALIGLCCQKTDFYRLLTGYLLAFSRGPHHDVWRRL